MRSRRRVGAVCLASGLLALGLLPAREARAQAGVLPGSERPETPPFAPEAPPEEPLTLPPVPPAPPPSPGEPAPGLEVFVRAFRVVGSTVFSPEELAALLEPFTGRKIDSAELLRARDAVTQLYVDHGYLTSGALVPDQTVSDGEITIQVVEGALSEIRVEGTKRFRPGFFRTRLARAGRSPVSVYRLEAQLQRIQRDPWVRRVSAQLLPGARRGESILVVAVEENRFYGLELGYANDTNPSIGSDTGHAWPVVANLLGWGDEWRGELEVSEGLWQVDGSFRIPLPPFDTRFGLHFQWSESDVVESPFDALDIHAKFVTWGVEVSQPVYRSHTQQARIGVLGEYRTSETKVLDECFAFVPNTGDCKDEIAVLRFVGDWTRATARNVVAARSTTSVGVHALGSTKRPGSLPDSEFVVWLGQLQWAYRLPEVLWETEVLARLDVQTASRSLLAMEKFGIGGMRTVRGYRENQFVRDNGIVSSIELRIPLWRDGTGRPVLELAPFVDYGRSWDEGPYAAQNLGSAGVGVRVSPWRWLHGELYWGGRLWDAPKPGHDLQNDGISFSLVLKAF